MVGMIRVDNAKSGIEYFPDSDVEVGNLSEIKHIKNKDARFVVDDFEHTVSKNARTRVDTENDFFYRFAINHLKQI